MPVALEEVKEALRADPNYGPAHNVAGLIYGQLKEDRLAEESFQRALRINPTDSDANNNYGLFLCQRKREQEAIGYFLAAVTQPALSDSRSLLRQCRRVRAPERRPGGRGRVISSMALKMRPTQPQALYQMADMSYARGDYGEAQELSQPPDPGGAAERRGAVARRARRAQAGRPQLRSELRAAAAQQVSRIRGRRARWSRASTNERSRRHSADCGRQRRRSAAPACGSSEARQAQNLTAADVARQLKLSVWQVEALEAGQLRAAARPDLRARLHPQLRAAAQARPGGAAACGTRTACRSPRRARRRRRRRDIPFPAAESWRWQRYAAAAAVIVAVLAVYEFFSETSPRTVTTQPGPVAALPPPQEPQQAVPPQDSRGEAAGAAAGRCHGDRRRRWRPRRPLACRAAAGAQSAAPDEREVRLVFEQESWVEIRDRNDEAIFSQLNRAGHRAARERRAAAHGRGRQRARRAR